MAGDGSFEDHPDSNETSRKHQFGTREAHTGAGNPAWGTDPCGGADAVPPADGSFVQASGGVALQPAKAACGGAAARLLGNSPVLGSGSGAGIFADSAGSDHSCRRIYFRAGRRAFFNGSFRLFLYHPDFHPGKNIRTALLSFSVSTWRKPLDSAQRKSARVGGLVRVSDSRPAQAAVHLFGCFGTAKIFKIFAGVHSGADSGAFGLFVRRRRPWQRQLLEGGFSFLRGGGSRRFGVFYLARRYRQKQKAVSETVG